MNKEAYITASVIGLDDSGRLRVNIMESKGHIHTVIEKNVVISADRLHADPELKDAMVDAVIGYLSKYKSIRKELADVETRRKSLWDKYAAPSAIRYSRMPKSHTDSDLSDMSAKLEEYDQLLKEKQVRLIKLEMEIYRAIDGLESHEEKAVLRGYYIDGKSWRAIARSIPCAERTVYDIKARAIDNLITLQSSA